MPTSGPLFDGRAPGILDEAVRKMRKDVAQEGQKLARAALASSIHRQSTGRAIADVTVIEASRTFSTGKYTISADVPAETDVVTTSLATYGPWLEGSGSRNSSTRFKGYHDFRMAAQELEGRAQAIADKSLAPFIARLNE